MKLALFIAKLLSYQFMTLHLEYGFHFASFNQIFLKLVLELPP